MGETNTNASAKEYIRTPYSGWMYVEVGNLAFRLNRLVPYSNGVTLLLPAGLRIIVCIGTVVSPEWRSSDCSAVMLQLSPKREAQYLDMKAQ